MSDTENDGNGDRLGPSGSGEGPGSGASAEISKTLKTRRGYCKGLLTRALNDLQMCVAEEEVDETVRLLEVVKVKFRDFQKAHDKYYATLIEPAEQIECEHYYETKQQEYVSVIKSAKTWLKAIGVKAFNVAPSRDGSPLSTVDDVGTGPRQDGLNSFGGAISRQDILSAVNLPKVELEKFDGDPMRFHEFFAAFDENVHEITSDGRLRLSRLLQYCTGKAKDAIRACAIIGGDAGYKQARSILSSRFGDSHIVAQGVIQGLKSSKPIKSSDELRHFADELCTAHATLESMGKVAQVDTQASILGIADCLPIYVKSRWKRYAIEVKNKDGDYPQFDDFVKFVLGQAQEATDPVYGSWNLPKRAVKCTTAPERKHPSSQSFFSAQVPSSKSSCVLCSEGHNLFWCPKFKAMKPSERFKFVEDNKLCKNCLMGNHMVDTCRKPSVCSVPGCGQKHTKFIHLDRPERKDQVRSATVVNVHRVEAVPRDEPGVRACVPLVAVTVDNNYSAVALLDTGSNTTFCTRKLVNALGKTGFSMKYALTTLANSKDIRETELVNLELSSKDGNCKLHLKNVYVVDDIPVANHVVDVGMHVHLLGLPVIVSGDVDLLIGQDNCEALLPLEVKRGRSGDPFAVRTCLGWSVNGPVRSLENLGRQVVSNFIASDPVNCDVQNLWSVDNENTPRDKLGMSIEDRWVLQLWDQEVQFVDGHYQLPVPVRSNVGFPNNISVAMSRLKSVKRKLEIRGMYKQYDDEINKLIHKKYAEVVPLIDVNCSNVWYLPHHFVTSASKPGKIRVVFDCASRYLGQSLNDKCMSGPDMINKLQHVLLRFREYEYAVSADIETMYYQVRVPASQRNYLRFLWWDDSGNIQHYRMCVHVFGGVWSGSAAGYALKRVVEDFDVPKLIREVVNNAFYVDDCLLSISSRDQAAEVIQGLKEVLRCGGFNLTKFIVNDECLLNGITGVDRAVEVKDLCCDIDSKVLGVRWKVKSDILHFHVSLRDISRVTRRSMLSTVASLYDPLGLIAPVIVVGRMLFQEVTRLKLNWDDPVSEDLAGSWLKWLNSLDKLDGLLIPRCVTSREFEDAYMELHHFSDASSRAYGCCCYLRCLSKSGDIHVALVYGKGRVAPMKELSIPRLELQAALIAARVDAMLREQLNLQLGKSTFWVDSEIVLHYIANESRRFHVFVANRVSEIRGLTEPIQWKFIAGDVNPADIVSRGMAPEDLMLSSWIRGPEFLRMHRDKWPVVHHIGNVGGDPELKETKVVSNVVHVSSDIHPLDALIAHYSDWYRLKRALCWLIRSRRWLKGDVKSGQLTVGEMRAAETTLIKHVQLQYFPEEVNKLLAGEKISKSSFVRDFLPVLNDEGLLCVGGRIKNATIDFHSKHPIILPHKGRVTLLIVREAHEVAHLGSEWVLSGLRCKYWIIKARSLLKKIKNACLVCRKLFASPGSQKMASLPNERVMHGNPPFSVVGTDCFGPILVKVGRSQVKRYGCLFTCFSIRAVHIEIMASMDTDSVINAFRRFIARRGIPLKILSDLGTNYVGAKNELSRGLKELSKSKIHEFCLKQNVDWVFNPPCAPHMGGVFERMVKSVKRVLNAILQNARLTDEILSTVMCEVENLVNSRPITKVSSDSDDQAALTPNHLLMLRGSASPIPVVSCIADTYRRRWRYVQHLSDVFWSRWIKEYLPTLQRTTKWQEVQKNIKVNDLVLLVDDHTPRGLWPMGIVTGVKVGQDGLVRSVHVRTKVTELVRPVTKIVFLESAS